MSVFGAWRTIDLKRVTLPFLISLILGAIVAGQIKSHWNRDQAIVLTGPVIVETNRMRQGVVGPDVIVSRLKSIRNWGTVSGTTGYSLSTTSCNIGDELAIWIDEGPEPWRHPLIAQNLYRYHDGRIDQIGMSWVKHSFCAVDEFDSSFCGDCQANENCDYLAIGCSDTYGSVLNGMQGYWQGVLGGLGPRSEVNAATGVYPIPYTLQAGQTGDVIFKRIQVRVEDVDPTLNPGARYFMEAYYLTTD
jgi:hypothetical protein